MAKISLEDAIKRANDNHRDEEEVVVLDQDYDMDADANPVPAGHEKAVTILGKAGKRISKALASDIGLKMGEVKTAKEFDDEVREDLEERAKLSPEELAKRNKADVKTKAVSMGTTTPGVVPNSAPSAENK